MTSPNEADGPYAQVLLQAERLVLAKFAREQEARRQRMRLQEESRQMQRERASFLQRFDATPMSALDYEQWLLSYVDAGGEVQEVRDAAFPAVDMLADGEDHIFQQLAREISGPSGDLAREYYSQPVFWTIDKPLTLAEIPELLHEQRLQLHLTREAARGITRSALQAWYAGGMAGQTELYLDGFWQDDSWHEGAWACASSVCIWQENYRDMLGLAPTSSTR